jgi:cytochrome P450
MSASNPQRPAAVFPDPLASREGWLEPFSWYRRMREENPVRYDPEREVWDVFRYDDVKAVLQRDETFSSDPSHLPRFREEMGERERPPVLDTMLFSDPPEHGRLRGVAEDFFRPNAIKEWGPRIEAITTDLLDDVGDDGEMDLVADLAYPMPVIVIAELLGVPPADRDRFREWSNTLISRPDATTEAGMREFQRRQEETQREMQEYFSRMMEVRREGPREDLLSEIVRAGDDGRLTEREMLGFCILMLVAGNITTTNLITNAVRCFAEGNGWFDDLRRDDAALGRAIEEVLRYRSPVQAFFRVTKTDAELGGVEIPAGEGLVVWLGSANRDERRFDAPDEFRPARSPNQHLGFGYGTHYCLGAPLARLEAKIALTEVLDRFRDVELADAELQPVRSSFIYGVEHLPVTFDPAG